MRKTVSVRQSLIDRLKTAGSRVVLDLLFDGKAIGLKPGRGDIAGFGPAEKDRRDLPPMMVVGDDRDALFVVAHERADDRSPVVGIERDAVAEGELQHGGVRSHLLQKTQPLDDPSVERLFGKSPLRPGAPA